MNDLSIEVLGRASRIRYRHGSRSIYVESEPLIGSPALVIYSGSITTWDDGRAVTAQEKAEIIANIKRMMRSKWGDIDVA